MKRLYILSFLSLIAGSSFGQLSFDDIGTNPAYCRLFSYQNGGGLIWASATGGTPPYSYEWENLGNGATSSNTTWGGLNPGNYEIVIWDAAGDTITQVITLDSLNPIAAIGVVPGPLSDFNPIYYGTASVTVEFINQSQNYANPNNPNADTTFFWRMTQWENWTLVQDIVPNQQFTYTNSGYWGVDLVAINKNGCTDTATVYISLAGPAGILNQELIDVQVISNASNNQLIVNSLLESDAQFLIYDLSGKLILSENLTGETNTINFDQKTGIYLYKIQDSKSGSILRTGKFSF